MGIRGLSTFIGERADKYLTNYELSDTKLVIDGNNIASHLYQWVYKGQSAFGGEYDVYFEVVSSFFLSLKTCNITPIVFFDGGYEQKKIKTIFTRLRKKISTLRSFTSSHSKKDFFPIFMIQTFCYAARENGAIVIQSDFEADQDMAILARQLQCPLLSYDSDFFMFDVLYIPFSNMVLQPEKGSKYYIPCSLFDMSNFCRRHPGLNKSHLPIISALVGNDYIDGKKFNHFFEHIKLPQGKMTTSHKKIHGILEWIRYETPESAIKKITTYLPNGKEKFVIEAMKKSIDDFDNLSKLVAVKKWDIRKSHEVVFSHELLSNLPPTTLRLYREYKLPSFLIDIVTLSMYVAPLQVEDTTENANMVSIPIIRAITYLFYSLVGKEVNKEFKIYLIKGRDVVGHVVEVNAESFTPRNMTADILKTAPNKRKKILCQLLCLCKEDEGVIKSFPETWQLYILSFIFWLKCYKGNIMSAHVHAILLLVICIQVVQRKTEFFSSYSNFMKAKAGRINRLSKTCQINPLPTNDLLLLIKNVSELECLEFAKSYVVPQHKMTTNKNYYSIKDVHTFATFQSCLYHITFLNVLLNYPYVDMKVAEFYNGTMAFNILMDLKNVNILSKINLIFSTGINLFKIYEIIDLNLNRYYCHLEDPGESLKKKRKKKKKVNKVNKEESVNDVEVEDSADAFSDIHNRFSVLNLKH